MCVAILIFVGLFAGSVGIGAGVARRTNPQRGLSQPAHRFLRRGDLAVGGLAEVGTRVAAPLIWGRVSAARLSHCDGRHPCRPPSSED